MSLRNLCVVLLFASALCGAARGQSQINPAEQVEKQKAWEYGPFFNGGVGVGDRSSYSFVAAGVQVGKPISRVLRAGIFTGQFEAGGDIMPYWQSFTPGPHMESASYHGIKYNYEVNGGTFTGFTMTPLLLRWNFTRGSRRFLPWFQGAGGILYTTHKYPPAQIVPEGTPGGTSVFNFTPQGGVGVHYFFRPGRSIDLKANAVHISSASLGDKNPGVNASFQFQLGYTWWRVR